MVFWEEGDNFSIRQGETFYQNCQWLYLNETPVDLSGYVGRCKIRRGAQNQGVITTMPVTITDAANGKFAISLTASQTAALPVQTSHFNEYEIFDYDVEFETPDGIVYRPLNGYLRVSPEVTK